MLPRFLNNMVRVGADKKHADTEKTHSRRGVSQHTARDAKLADIKDPWDTVVTHII